MKFFAKTDIQNRDIPNGSRKLQKSTIALGKQSDELYILIQTPQNKIGNKYKVLNNIDQVFTKFMKEGKATIRFKSPPHDLIVQSDPIQLKAFLVNLRNAFDLKISPKSVQLSNLKSTPNFNAVRSRMTVTTKEKYPYTAGFPRMLETLQINNVKYIKFNQIALLKNLTHLNLMGNDLNDIPECLGSLPTLRNLNLSENSLGRHYDPKKWSWMNCYQVTQSLETLDLSKNELLYVPPQIGKMNKLVNLNLCKNKIVRLPQSIGHLNKLKNLYLHDNQLINLPGSIKRLHLITIDLSENSFQNTEKKALENKLGTPSLKDLAANVVLQNRLYYNAAIIPQTLVKSLDNALYCPCGRACFDNYLKKNIIFDINLIASTTIFSTLSFGPLVPIETFFCSTRCLATLKTPIERSFN